MRPKFSTGIECCLLFLLMLPTASCQEEIEKRRYEEVLSELVKRRQEPILFELEFTIVNRYLQTTPIGKSLLENPPVPDPNEKSNERRFQTVNRN